MKSPVPLVSVYIPTRNRKELLRQAIESTLAQTYPSIEVIVADDASEDGTEAMMRAWCERDSRLRYLRLARPSGANAARNAAILAARGEFVTGLDDDDIMLPERVEKLAKAYRNDLAFVTSRYYIDDGRGRHTKRLTRKTRITLRDMLYTNIVGNQVFSTKKRFLEAGLFDESLSAAQDYDMWVRMLQQGGEGRVLKEPLQIVRIGSHPSITASSRKRKGYRRLFFKQRALMGRDHRRYRLLGLRLTSETPFFRALSLLPRHPKYMVISLIRIYRAKRQNA